MDELLEPELLYKSQLKDKHHDNVVKYFNKLVETSKIDKGANNLTCSKYYKENEKLKLLEKKSKRLSILKVFFILLAFLVIGIFLLLFVYKPKRKALDEEIKSQQKVVEKLLNEATEQMAPLNALFESSIPSKIMETTTPLIDMDRIFDIKKYEILHDKFGLWDNKDEKSSTLDIQSGSILGNPFVVFKDLRKEIIQQRYEGTLVISYTVGSGDNKHTVTETLTAYVTRPKPVYSKETYLVYGNEAAMNLSFSRMPSKINSMDEKEIDKYVRHHERELVKIAEKATKKGGSYTQLGNPEFELFFGGLDRDNEIEYRLLFTPLAQKSMLQLLKSKVGFGDDFRFIKRKGLNIIQSNHSQGEALFVNKEAFTGFDFEAMEKFFIEFNDAYFKALFFDFAPLLSIPLYQQHKAHEYIYKDTVKSNFNCFEHEVLANKFDIRKFLPSGADTDVILKTSFVKKDKESDIVNVSSHAYKAFKRLEHIPTRGGDGRIHDVPVEYVEYIPVSREEQITISDLGVDDEIKFAKLGQNGVIYAKGLVSSMNKDNLNVDINKLKSSMKKD